METVASEEAIDVLGKAQSSVAARLQKIMRTKKIKQIDIVRGIGVSKSAVSKWISGSASPHTYTMMELATLLGVSYEWLAHGDDTASHVAKVIIPIDDLDTDTVANRIKTAMFKKGIKPPALTKLVGTNSNAIHSWLSGDVTPHFRSINRLATALDVSPNWLAYGDKYDSLTGVSSKPAYPSSDAFPAVDIGIGGRIKEIMYKKNIIAINLSKSVGASRGAVSKWLSGDSIPSHGYIIKLAVSLDTSYKWLAYGQSEPTTAKPYNNTPTTTPTPVAANVNSNPAPTNPQLGSQPHLRYSNAPAHADEYEVSYFKILYPSNEDIINAGKTKQSLPVLLKTPFTAKAKRALAKRCRASTTDSFCYRNESDSMKPRIMDNALCIADRSRTEIRDGKIYVFRHGVTLKTRFLQRCADGSLIIRSQNDDYPNEVVPVDKLHMVDILGWVYCTVNKDK